MLLKSNHWQTSFGIMRWIDIFLLHLKKQENPPPLAPKPTRTCDWGKFLSNWHFPVAGTSRAILVCFFVSVQCHPGDQQKQCRSSVELSKGHWSFWAVRASLVDGGLLGQQNMAAQWTQMSAAKLREGPGWIFLCWREHFLGGKWWMEYTSLYLPVEAILRNTDL